MATTYLHTNNASSILATAITAASTTIRVQTGQGTLFPNPGVDQGFFVTVEDRRLGKLEIMLCTARTGDTMTVTRGQQGTVPQSFGVGVNVSNRVTAQILNEFVAATVAVVPIERIPAIPDSKLTTINANRLFGTMASTVLPVIPASKLTSVPSASLTGTINEGRLPDPLPASKLPEIPAAKLTSVPSASLTGTINAARLPAIPASKLTSVPSDSLTGTVPSEVLNATAYNSFHTIRGDTICYFPRFAGYGENGTGQAVAPTFTWSGYSNYGMWLNPPSSEIVFSTGGVNRFKIGPTAVIAYNGAKFTGDGSGLTNLPITTSEILGLQAGADAGDIGTYALLAFRNLGDGTVWNQVYSGSLLTRAAMSNGILTPAAGMPVVSGQWQAMCEFDVDPGVRGGGLFLRVS